ncbi:phage head closure protein [Clostridium botulinum]|uniref:Phage head-tail adapter protein n=1 Tax=Clostridium botulinum TaxID=1491 RepID=A0A6B4JIP7_CLOBO|nr:phage head closure protein [Clostridium botulinum]EES50858.1 phage head-tail adaptor, putative [Clostridium botulinum E1 str. 'BoNT E Beluga']MBY6760574.1 phage head closure protein [Clostridium botulinum]MBY6919481.1 phage head closure protein [Clostridium botulinum]MCR1130359.1 phage head closure protein [Clostridium botulinum]NFJ56886.1 phage head-tail adapter protein [Clostridium botulinum]
MSKSERINITVVAEKRINGKPIKSDEPFYNCWCEILQLYGTELYQAINIKLENTIIFKVRYCKLLEQLQDKKEYKVNFKGHTYKIYHTDFAKEYKKYILLKCDFIK